MIVYSPGEGGDSLMALDFRSYLLPVTSVEATDLYRAVPPAA